jgi:nucleoid-associated protein YgaU
MGQLERYGLYVLVLVIFLILGVAIWGGDPSPARSEPPPAGREAQEPPRSDLTARGNASSYLELVDDPVVDDAAAGGRSAGAVPAVATDAEAAKSTPKTEPAPAAEPEPGVRKERPPLPTYTIRKQDTLGEIAKRELGSFHHWEMILALNPGLDPNRLKPGTAIKLPHREMLAQSTKAPAKPAGKARNTHTVREGESFASISKRWFQTEKHADAIMKANGYADARKLRVGAVLTIPDPEND